MNKIDLHPYLKEVRFYKVLMHPLRLAILDLLRDGEQCVCHMEAVFGLRQAYISQQLMVLRSAGLVEVRREGLNIYYRVTQPEIYTVIDAMRRMTQTEPVLPTEPLLPCRCPTCEVTQVQL
ncbi:MAG: metalloregulator ArsR/SmtB family transcription factor [Anaerolineales bacterium]